VFQGPIVGERSVFLKTLPKVGHLLEEKTTDGRFCEALETSGRPFRPFPDDWRCDWQATATMLGTFLETVRQEHGGVAPIVVGHSMGGMRTLAVLRRRPDRFGALGLYAPGRARSAGWDAFFAETLERAQAFRVAMLQGPAAMVSVLVVRSERHRTLAAVRRVGARGRAVGFLRGAEGARRRTRSRDAPAAAAEAGRLPVRSRMIIC
jgi:pimeloyl-ACP methyl ester carboxylesterase